MTGQSQLLFLRVVHFTAAFIDELITLWSAVVKAVEPLVPRSTSDAVIAIKKAVMELVEEIPNLNLQGAYLQFVIARVGDGPIHGVQHQIKQ